MIELKNILAELSKRIKQKHPEPEHKKILYHQNDHADTHYILVFGTLISKQVYRSFDQTAVIDFFDRYFTIAVVLSIDIKLIILVYPDYVDNTNK